MIDGAEIAWSAFSALRGDRAVGASGAGPIPFVALDAYARRYGVSGADFETLHHLVSVLDTAYLKHVAEKQRAPGK